MGQDQSQFIKAGKSSIAVLTLFATLVALYSFFFEKKIEIKCDVISNNNVLDVRENLSKLDILYDSKSIKAINGNLRLVSIRFSNAGSQNILKEFYDDNDPFGIKIINGRVIERPEVTQTSNDYLKQNLTIFVIDSLQKLVFSKVILEPGEFFIVKFLVLHELDKTPNFSLVGKIAGIKEFVPKTYPIDAIYIEGPSFLEFSFGGSFLSQVARFFVYGILAVSLSIGILLIIIKIEKYKKKNNT